MINYKDRYLQSIENGSFPHEQENIDNPVEITITIEEREHEFLKAICNYNSFTDSIQNIISNLIRGSANDGLSLQDMSDIINGICEENKICISNFEPIPKRKHIKSKSKKDDNIPFWLPFS